MIPMKPFVNRATELVFLTVLTEWCPDNPAEVAREWEDMGGADPAELLAARLKKDFRGQFYFEDDALADLFFRMGLRKVCWKQVAERLLACSEPRQEEPAGEEDDEPGDSLQGAG